MFFFSIFFLASVAARFQVTFLLKKTCFFEPSRRVLLGGLFFCFFVFLVEDFSFFYFFFDFIFHFFCGTKKNGKNNENKCMHKKQEKMKRKEMQASLTSVTVGRDADRPKFWSL